MFDKHCLLLTHWVTFAPHKLKDKQETFIADIESSFSKLRTERLRLSHIVKACNMCSITFNIFHINAMLFIVGNHTPEKASSIAA